MSMLFERRPNVRLVARAVLSLAALFFMPLFAVSGCGGAPGWDPPRRVIWIAVDSLRADRLGSYGYKGKSSPWLDELAAGSVRFDWAISPSNHTIRSVGGYFTGKPYTAIHPNAASIGIPDREDTLAEVLRDAGIRTVGWTSNLNLLAENGYTQGFREYRVLAPPGRAAAYIDDIIEDVRTNYTRSKVREFIYIHTMDVHLPYRPAHPFGVKFMTPYLGTRVREGALLRDDGSQMFSTAPYWYDDAPLTEEDVTSLRQLYDACVAYTDSRMPRLLEALDWNPKRDVLIISADHGEHLMEMGWWSHFATLTPREIHVPLIVNYAGFDPGVVGEQVSLLDLFPTIVELFGLPAREGLAGTSLTRDLAGDTGPSHPVYSETSPKNGLGAAIVSDSHWYWLSMNRSQIEPWHPWPYEEYLYRYRDDPEGLNNLVGVDTDAADEMNELLRTFNSRWSAYTRDRVQGDDSGVSFGENLLTPMSPLEGRSVAALDADRRKMEVDSTATNFRFEATGLVPFEPLFLKMNYRLVSGSVRLRGSPVEYLLPAHGLPSSEWHHRWVIPTEHGVFESVIVPLGERIEFTIDCRQGTQATVEFPTLHRMLFERVEPWPQLPENREANWEINRELREQLEAQGYLK